jgi:hypothetical protein
MDDSRYIGKTAYNTYDALPMMAYNCICRLMDENELVWKLLKYAHPDAWKQDNLTSEEKRAMIYTGQEDATKFRIFLDGGQPDVWTREDCILRISPYSIFPENRTIGTVTMIFEVFSHYKINHLSNYTTRVDVVIAELLKTFNGADGIGGIGKLAFDSLSNKEIRVATGGQIPFKGKWMLMSNKSG